MRSAAHWRVPINSLSKEFPNIKHTTYLEYIPLGYRLARLLTLQHLLQKFSLLLHLGDFLRRLGPIVSLVPIVVPSHNLHEPISLLQVGRGAPPDKFLQLSRLRLALFLLHLLGRSQILQSTVRNNNAKKNRDGRPYITRVQNSRILRADLREHIALVKQ